MSRLGDFAVGAIARPSAGALAASGPGIAINASGFRSGQSLVITGEPTGGGGSDTLAVKLQHSPPPVVSENSSGYDGTDDGSEKLRDGAASNVAFAIPFTPDDDLTIWKVKLMLSKLGTPAIAAGGIPWVLVQVRPDDSGDPDASSIAASFYIRTADIPEALSEVEFLFSDGFELSAATPYWLVITGNYDVDANNCIQVHYDDATSGCKYYDSAWAALTDKNIWVVMEDLYFEDVPTSEVPVVTFTEGTILNELIEGLDRQEVNMEMLNKYLRGYYTISGGTWGIGHGMYLGDPKVQPATP
jgi:hypothetical protein